MKTIDPGLRQFYDPNTGNPAANGYVATYDTISYSPKVTYADINGTVENPNPVPLDSTGSCYLFGEGSFNLKVLDNTMTVVRELLNVGVEATSGYVVNADTNVLNPGDGGTGTFTADDLLAIYGDNEAKSLLGVAHIGDIVMTGSGETGNIAGSYSNVQQMYSDSSSAPPDNVIVIDGPIDGYDPDSNRIYQWTPDGNFGLDPQADTYGQDGKGENWNDLLRLAITEELRLKKAVMRWDDCKDILGKIEVSTPIMVFGSDGILYKAIGSPTAEQLSTVDPVTESPRAVWTYVYDPTETAAYPPGYYSPKTGVDFGSTARLEFPMQAVKLRSASSGLFENDGELEEVYYKNLTEFRYSVGTSGTPTGCYYTGAFNTGGDTGWLAAYVIKTTSTEVCVVTAPTNIAPSVVLTAVNALAAESAAGRVWSYYRRIAYVRVVAGLIVQFKRVGTSYDWYSPPLGGGFSTRSTTAPGSANTVAMSAPPLTVAKGALISVFPGTPSTPDSIYVRICGYGQSTGTGYDVYSLVTSDSADMPAFNFERLVDSSSNITVYLQPTNNTASWSYYITSLGWTDLLED